MESDDVTLTNNWIDRRFFLSNLLSAPRLFCCNTSNGFAFGQINLDNDEFLCEPVDTNNYGYRINELCWLSNTIYRPSQKEIKIGFTSLPRIDENQHASLIYNSEISDKKTQLKELDHFPNHLTPTSIDYNESVDGIAISHLNGTVNIYHASQYKLLNQFTFINNGFLHKLQWNPIESHLLLLAHQNRINIFDYKRQMNKLTLNHTGNEHLADCTWKTNDVVVGRHRQQILIWDKRISREPVRNETLDLVGHAEKLKCSLASPNHLLSIYDSRLAKIKIFDFRFLTMRQVETFDDISTSFLDYHWTIDKMAIVVGTHQGLLHWIDVDVPLKSKNIHKKQ